MPRFKRQQYYADPSVQSTLIKRIVFHWACFFCAVVGLSIFLEFMFGNPYRSFSSTVRNVMGDYGLFVFMLLTLIPVFVLDTIKVSNRFVGPMVRLRRSVKALAEGHDVKPIHFRDHDLWKDLADDFNGVLVRLYAAENKDISAEGTSQVDGETEGLETPLCNS